MDDFAPGEITLDQHSRVLPRNRPRSIGAVLQSGAPNPIELMSWSVKISSIRRRTSVALTGPIDPPRTSADRQCKGDRPDDLICHYSLPRPAPL